MKSDFRVGRLLQAVNGRPARKYQEPGCTDPKTGTPEPLGFLAGKESGSIPVHAPRRSPWAVPPGTRAVDFIETPPERVRITWKGNCFEAEGGGHEGRVWFDPETFDILQVEVRLSKPFLVPMPPGYIGLHRPSEWNGLKARCASLV